MPKPNVDGIMEMVRKYGELKESLGMDLICGFEKGLPERAGEAYANIAIAIRARVAELVAQAREEGRREALHPPIDDGGKAFRVLCNLESFMAEGIESEIDAMTDEQVHAQCVESGFDTVEVMRRTKEAIIKANEKHRCHTINGGVDGPDEPEGWANR